MAVLTDEEVKELWREFAELGKDRGLLEGIDKRQLLAAFAAANTWVDGSAVSYNAALPLPARTVLSAKQKAWIRMLVERKYMERL